MSRGFQDENFCGIGVYIKKDGKWKVFLDDPVRYADVINGIGCAGAQIVSPADLRDADTQYPGFRIPGFVKKLVRETVWKRPKIRRFVRKNPEGLTSGEYLYGFKKDSRLFPVTTYVLYGGTEKWDGPTSLHEMLDLTDIPTAFRKRIPDYKINLISLRDIKDTSVFKTDVKNLIDFIKCVSDSEQMKELINNDPYFRNVEEDAYDVMSGYMNVARLDVTKVEYMKEGKVDMCEALRGWLDEENEKKYAEGRAAGHAEGRAEGHTEGRAEGIIKTARKYHAADEEILHQLIEELSINIEMARSYLEKY